MGGIVLTDFGSDFYASGFGLDIQSDGKIVVGASIDSTVTGDSNFSLLRYNANGTLDTSFSGDGQVSLNVNPDDIAIHVQVQSSGKIILGGFSGNGETGQYDFFLARYNSDGSLDNTFSGDGRLTANFGGEDRARAMVVQNDGKILLGGMSDGDFAVARYNTDGALDLTFGGGDGVAFTDFGGEDSGRSMLLQADGKIILAGASEVGDSSDFALVRYNTNGTLDTTFSGDGKLTTNMGGFDTGFAVALQSGGKILLAGTSHENYALARYTSTGALDTTFGGGDGKVETDFSGSDVARDVVVLASGKFLVSGYLDSEPGGFTLARYNANGTLDTSFSGDGKVTTDIPGGIDYNYRMAVQSDGKIVLSGENFDTVANNSYLALVRYNIDGTLDTTFGASTGTRGSDSLTGTTAVDMIQGLAGNDTIIGLGGSDTLEGGQGNDVLIGGAGKDSLTGGSGADNFRFNAALSASNIDTIRDFDTSSDLIQIDNAIFTQLTATGALKASNFRANASGNAADSNDYILYSTDTGKLFYDADGNGAGAKVVFAVIGTSTHAALAAADFVVI